MILPYVPRLVILSLALFFVVHMLLSGAVALLAPWVIRKLNRAPAASEFAVLSSAAAKWTGPACGGRPLRAQLSGTGAGSIAGTCRLGQSSGSRARRLNVVHFHSPNVACRPLLVGLGPEVRTGRPRDQLAWRQPPDFGGKKFLADVRSGRRLPSPSDRFAGSAGSSAPCTVDGGAAA